MTSTAAEFTEKICQTAYQATILHYTAKSQVSFLKMLKDAIVPDTEAVISLDFSENY
jgi:hypothetical protein